MFIKAGDLSSVVFTNFDRCHCPQFKTRNTNMLSQQINLYFQYCLSQLCCHCHMTSATTRTCANIQPQTSFSVASFLKLEMCSHRSRIKVILRYSVGSRGHKRNFAVSFWIYNQAPCSSFVPLGTNIALCRPARIE